jgi:hypothetical protein
MASNLFAKQHPNKMKNTQSWQGKKQQDIEGKYAKVLETGARCWILDADTGGLLHISDSEPIAHHRLSSI